MAMMRNRLFTPIFVAALSLGFLGHSPFSAPSKRRIASSACVDPQAKPGPKPSAGSPFVSQLFPFLGLVSHPLNSFEAYSQFLLQLRVQQATEALRPLGEMSIYNPMFPSYASPRIPEFTLARPDSSKQIWGSGLLSDPDLQYLTQATPTPPMQQQAVTAVLSAPSFDSSAGASPSVASGIQFSGNGGISSSRF